MKIKTLVLHVGMPKCGTSTIQNMSRKYSSELEDYGVLYPSFPFLEKSIKNKSNISTGNANHLVYALFKQAGKNVGAIAWDMKKVNASIEDRFVKSTANIIVLSHEDLVSILGELKLFCQHWQSLGVRVLIVMHLRDQISWLASDYQQHVKQLKCSSSITDHVAKRLPLLNYTTLCKHFEQMVGRENLIVKVLSSESIHSNILFDFYANLGVEIPEFSTLTIDNSNVGLNHLAVDVLATLNNKEMEESDYNRLYKVLSGYSFGNKSSYVIPLSIRQTIFSTCKEWNKSLNPYLFCESDVIALENSMQKALNARDIQVTAKDIAEMLCCFVDVFNTT